MKRRSHIPFLFWILLTACVLPLLYAVYKGQKEFALAGLVPAVILVIALIAFKVRSRQFQKILRREGHLLYFEYDAGEVEEIIDHELPKIKKASYGLAMLFDICLMIIFTPFALMILKSNPISPVWTAFVSAILLPVLGALYAPQATAGKIRKYPCVTAVGRDYILISNRYPGINDYSKLKLDHADLENSKMDTMRWLRLSYSYAAMKNATRIQKTVDVPVPRNKIDEAESFVLQYENKGKPRSIHG